MSITFVGFNVNRDGVLTDPVSGNVIEGTSMKPQLYTGLKQNGVNLSENYQLWDKQTMIEKIGMVMGLEWLIDPDPSYVLTVDNVIKMLAIQMRFRYNSMMALSHPNSMQPLILILPHRCNIPVVIMGETGCGKTRLIRYMTDVIGHGCRNGGADVRNMLTMKVSSRCMCYHVTNLFLRVWCFVKIHGGTTEEDVVNNVKKAEEISVVNKEQHGVDTVLFFDEANTSDAIGLIKEVMCDRRIHGRAVNADVKFIAACNPYRK